MIEIHLDVLMLKIARFSLEVGHRRIYFLLNAKGATVFAFDPRYNIFAAMRYDEMQNWPALGEGFTNKTFIYELLVGDNFRVNSPTILFGGGIKAKLLDATAPPREISMAVLFNGDEIEMRAPRLDERVIVMHMMLSAESDFCFDAPIRSESIKYVSEVAETVLEGPVKFSVDKEMLHIDVWGNKLHLHIDYERGEGAAPRTGSGSPVVVSAMTLKRLFFLRAIRPDYLLVVHLRPAAKPFAIFQNTAEKDAYFVLGIE